MASKEQDLVEHARKELRKCKGKWEQLSKASGRELSYRWLVGFADGEIKDPSARKIILLGKYIGFRVVHTPGPHFLKFTPE